MLTQKDKTVDEQSGERKRFIWRYGVLGWGLLTGVACTLTMHVSQFGWSHFMSVDFLIRVVVGLVIWPIAGYWFGASLWRSKQRRKA